MNVCFLIGCRFIKAFLTFFWLCFWLFWCFLLYIVMFCGNSSSSLFVIVGVSWFVGVGVLSMFGLLLSDIVGLFVDLYLSWNTL